MVMLSLTRRQFVLGTLAGVGLMMLPSSESFGVPSLPHRKSANAARMWLHGDPRSGCSHHSGVEWTCSRQP